MGDTARLELLISGDRYNIRLLEGGVWRVKRSGSTRVYEVAPGDRPSCSCPDYRRRHAGRDSACRHVRALVAVGLLAAGAAR